MRWDVHPLDPIPRVSSSYGMRSHPITGVASFHNGTDYATPVGTLVRSPRAGRVRFINRDPAGGLQLGIDLEGGGYVGFAHLSEVLVKDGDPVASAEAVARTGNSGASTGPHLHLVARDDEGNRIDPETVDIDADNVVTLEPIVIEPDDGGGKAGLALVVVVAAVALFMLGRK